ncbi:hypothetical protein CH330_03805 [candidate division WOR-3 bacterium JGI_Cruoil_03_51_56]|uniref:Uncharacterized protein n=1 Tax=candidate division WOR-3 bacterium JGI_Cruoil_03_51_56 TaxID=1973747 RepID=A0A235BTA1_UNCW3|nr:MAG: hypothetical protein CH330_05620 [candidate division WOR-3 bacterium JGI_Cruoil_03_51_56]OYD16067.1 MAG: hypothetical protein CH330_03805 [candidate division WOR-3 bacterium JGI_Cruoil_03_51_56]
MLDTTWRGRIILGVDMSNHGSKPKEDERMMKRNTAFVLVLLLLLQFVAVPIAQAKEEKGGVMPCLVGWFIGPRAGYMYNEGVKVRTMEIIRIFFFPVVIIDWINIFGGTTWTEIVQKEHLAASNFDAWHNYAAIR